MTDKVSVFDQIRSAVDFLRPKIVSGAKTAIILGTGLGALRKILTEQIEIPYDLIPFFPTSTVKSHEGKLISGLISGKKVIIMSGRFHYYEGYSMEEIAFPIRVLSALGIDKLVVSNMAGGLLSEMEKGDIYVIEDHINLMGNNPLIGPNDERIGPRFPDMKHAYSKKLMQIAVAQSEKIGIELKRTTYAGLSGPSLETPAEYKMLHILGAGLVGMSTVPEVITARHLNMEVLAFSIVSNVCYPIDRIEETTLESVIAVAQQSGNTLSEIIRKTIPNL